MKEILKELEKIKNNKDKLKYLEKLLKEAKAEDKKKIEEIIKELKGLEEKLQEVNVRREIIQVDDEPIIQGNVSLRRNVLEQEIINVGVNQETKTSYSSTGYGVNTLSYDTTSFNYIGNIGEMARDKLIQDNVFELSFSMESGRDSLGEKIRNISIGISEEEKIIYINNQSLNKEIKYVKKMR